MKTPDELFEEKQANMSNEALIGFVNDQITNLAKTGGKSHEMNVPPRITDTDMLFSEMLRRFKIMCNES